MSLLVENAPLGALKPCAKNARTHTKKQVAAIARSIRELGFNNPILVDANFEIIAGHARAKAAEQLKLESVPVIKLGNLSEQQKRAYRLADNRLAEKAGWDEDVLVEELLSLVEAELEVELSGFEIAEIDVLVDKTRAADPSGPGPEDAPIEVAETAITRPGDVWRLGRHVLVCGDARSKESYVDLLSGEDVDLIFTDPPYNVKINGHVRVKPGHREFAMAAGEMSRQQFVAFLKETLGPARDACRDGAVAFVCMDFRHMGELLEAGEAVFDTLKNLCVWTKANGGMGSFYRNQHELVFVYAARSGPILNTFELGQNGRYRTNVWAYAGANAFAGKRDSEFGLHPTVKPVALVADAIKDVSKRNDIVLDMFGGSGSTLIAAESCGRRARLIELDPLYCDVIVRRFHAYTGIEAVRDDGAPFSALSAPMLEACDA